MLALCTRACALAAWIARLGGSHCLVARVLIGWLFLHDLKENCDLCDSNIEFARAAAVCKREPTHRKRLAAAALNFPKAIVPLQFFCGVAWHLAAHC